MKIFTGVGSRSTPEKIQETMSDIAEYLAKQGFTLRSGGASGADEAFEIGCDRAGGKKEIYLPWKNFNKNKSLLFNVSQEALELAATIHPAWFACSYGAKKLHARNCQIVLGLNLDTPSNFLVCWTLHGKTFGGTATAINLAKKHNIPVYNLAIHAEIDLVLSNLHRL